MNKMRLFEVGFREKPDGGYYDKFYVGEEDAEGAVELARKHLVNKAEAWWASDDSEDVLFNAYAEDKSAPEDMPDDEIRSSEKYQKKWEKAHDEDLRIIRGLYLARVQDVGELIV